MYGEDKRGWEKEGRGNMYETNSANKRRGGEPLKGKGSRGMRTSSEA
jgi:hypothetical protein